jgi:hypothetical protein
MVASALKIDDTKLGGAAFCLDANVTVRHIKRDSPRDSCALPEMPPDAQYNTM